MYKLLALDLDGTLLRRDHTVDPRDIAAISELQAAGVTVTIVTGRLHCGAVQAAQACAISGPIACVEGSHLIDLDSQTTLAHHPIPGPAAQVVRDVIATHKLAGFVFDAEGIHHEHAGATFADYVRTWSPRIRICEETLAWQTQPLAAVAIGDADAIAEALATLGGFRETLFSVSFAIPAYPGKHALLARAQGPTKGTALAELCRGAGCELTEAVAVGDWANDVPMFEVAGRSFAMGQSPEHVVARATDVLDTSAGDGGGIAEAIRRAWG